MASYLSNFIVNTKTLPPIVTFYDIIHGYDPQIFTKVQIEQVGRFARGDRTNPKPDQEVHYLDLNIYHEEGYRKRVTLQLNYTTGKLRKLLFQKKLTTITIPEKVIQTAISRKRLRSSFR